MNDPYPYNDANEWFWNHRHLQYDHQNQNDTYGGYESSSFDDEKKSKILLIDYGVLSVAALTLGLILVVEVVRHKLDHWAGNTKFYHAVLERVYEECE
jgi:hypothetical protein